jgi:RNA polymerase sigma-70 factor (ECF subfamily)
LSESDTGLVIQSLAGVQEAGEILYARHGGRVKAYLLRSGFPDHIADDLTQDIFLGVFRSLGTFNPSRGKFTTWLGTVARNVVRKEWRKVPGPENYDGNLAAEVFETTEMEDPGIKEELDALRACISRLKEEHRQLIRLRFFKAMTTRGIAEVTGLAESTARLRLQEAKGLLLECMRRSGVEKD